MHISYRRFYGNESHRMIMKVCHLKSIPFNSLSFTGKIEGAVEIYISEEIMRREPIQLARETVH
jgi:hypothetical protein